MKTKVSRKTALEPYLVLLDFSSVDKETLGGLFWASSQETRARYLHTPFLSFLMSSRSSYIVEKASRKTVRRSSRRKTRQTRPADLGTTIYQALER